MSKDSELMLYIYKEYNENTKSEIEDKFKPYKIMLCDINFFCKEVYLGNTIRCVVNNGIITELGFN
jgi:hypothetical protein